MEEAFTRIIEQIFSNWSALQLAVEHSMGGPNSKQTAINTMSYMVTYCMTQKNLEVEDIEDTLEEILDQQFNTLCEDGSIKEVADILYKFLQLLQRGDFAQCELEYSRLPVSSGWMKSIQPQVLEEDTEIRPSTSNDPEKVESEEMEPELPGWTTVKTKRKK